MPCVFPWAVGQPRQEGNLLVDLRETRCNENCLFGVALDVVDIGKPNHTELAAVRKEIGSRKHHRRLV
jgi:hypothetical protein